jgi:uncharacterized protein
MTGATDKGLRLRFAALAGAIGLCALPCVSEAQTNSKERSVTIATATPGGNYFLSGNAICRGLHRQGLYLKTGEVTLINCAAMSTTGSIQNVDLLRNRTVDVALVQSDWHYHAYNGTDRFAGRKLEQLRSLLSLNSEAFQVLGARGMLIDRWDDLKGKKINVGPRGSTSDSMFQELFKVHGIDEKWLTQALRLQTTTHVQEMCEGNIEALAQVSGIPNTSISSAMRDCGANLVKIDTDEVRKMVRDRPYYAPTTIPKNTYSGQTENVETFAVVATLVTTTELPDEVAYSLVRAIFEGMKELGSQVRVLQDLIPEAMVSTGLSAPLHPGAERYFRERGLLRAQAKPVAPVAATPAVSSTAAAAVEPPKPDTPQSVAASTTPAAPAATAPPPSGGKRSIRGRARDKAGR